MIGDYLRKNREAANVSLQTLARRTRINAEYLHALEQNQFHHVPGEIYVRGYIRAYLAALSIDPAEAIHLYTARKGIRPTCSA